MIQCSVYPEKKMITILKMLIWYLQIVLMLFRWEMQGKSLY